MSGTRTHMEHIYICIRMYFILHRGGGICEKQDDLVQTEQPSRNVNLWKKLHSEACGQHACYNYENIIIDDNYNRISNMFHHVMMAFA